MKKLYINYEFRGHKGERKTNKTHLGEDIKDIKRYGKIIKIYDPLDESTG